MPNNNTHIINRVDLQFHASSPVSTDKLSVTVQRAIEDMEDLFDEHFDEAFYRLDSLFVELDIKEDELPRLESLLKKAFKEKIEKCALTAQATEYPEKYAPAEYSKSLALHFFKTGRFPWWAQAEAMDKIEQWIASISSEEWRKIIHPVAMRNNQVIERLAMQFPEALVWQLIRKSFKDTLRADEVIQFLRVVKEFSGHINLPYGQSKRLMRHLYAQTLRHALINKIDDETTVRQLIATALQNLTETASTGTRSKKEQKILEQWRQWLTDGEHRLQWMNMTDDVMSKEEFNAVEKKPEKADADDDLGEGKQFTISNAGLVLLHPFIETLFKNLGLLEDDGFRNEDARERAVCLLYHLASGGEEFPEHAVVLPKFLCDWPFSKPVDRFFPLSEYEKEECLSVLESSINHWETLKNTSVGELRSGFLMRDGLLKKEPFGWSLYVEEQTQDVLLEQLPWSLSVVKFKWIDEILTVQWRL